MSENNVVSMVEWPSSWNLVLCMTHSLLVSKMVMFLVGGWGRYVNRMQKSQRFCQVGVNLEVITVPC